MHILGTCVHIYTKYEVSMSNPVARRTDRQYTDNADADNDGQSMIVQGSLVDKPNKPKNYL